MESKKILYFEAPDGISGDMALGALIDLGADAKAIKNELDKIIPGEYELIPNMFERNGIHGINLEVIVIDDHDHVRHAHRKFTEIRNMISESGISETAKSYAIAIFEAIAEAEASVHGTDIKDVQFHEVGAIDSIIDIVGTAIAIDLLGVSGFYTAAPHDGSGTIACRHGLIPVPVPAVMEMAKGSGIPIIIESDVNTEMITPTGFGILKGLGAKFEPRLGVRPEKTGYGFGKRQTKRLAAVRITLGEKYNEPKDNAFNND